MGEQTALAIENLSLALAIQRLIKENERLTAALKECEAELDAYYRAEYPHQEYPSYVRKLEAALAANPARVALRGGKDE